MKNLKLFTKTFWNLPKTVSLLLCFFILGSHLQAQSTIFGPSNLINSSPVNTIYTADLDGDGDMDVLSGAGGKLSWYENNGASGFGPEQIIKIYTYVSVYSVYAADLDGDGDMDPIVAASYSETYYAWKLAWFENDGTGNFGTQQLVNNSTNLRGVKSVHAEDLDGDGDMDIISGSTAHVSWFENNGNGNFGPVQDITDSVFRVNTVRAADMDNDGDMDVLSCSPNDGKIAWYENDGTGGFGGQLVITTISYPFSPSTVYPSDLDGDGDMDVLTSSLTGSYGFDSKIKWYENDGTGNFSSSQTISISRAYVYPVDLDEDGDIDVLSISDNIVVWYENNGLGNFSTEHIISTLNDPRNIHASDLDGDGDMDVITNYDSYNGMVWFENQLSNYLYVDISASGNNNGRSWNDAFPDLQDALAAAEFGDSILIAEGTYLPTQTSTRGISFDIPNELTILGGYPTGGGTRDPNIYKTILSGNVDNDASIQGDSYHVVTIKDATNVKIDGLTIREGNANNPNSYARSRGGGVYLNNSIVEFKDVEFLWNRGIYGGAFFAKFSGVTIEESSFSKNRSDFGAAMYYSNASNITLLRSELVQNTSNNRCAIESNNASNTIIKNSLIANNASANANALGIIATNRNPTIEIINSTIIGGANNKNLITYQIGNNDQLDVTINNSIIAHQNPNFNKNMIAYNNNILNLNHNNCYFSGTSTIGNGTNNLYADIDGDLLLNTDYTINECSPAVNAGNNALATGLQDFFGNPRYYNTVDIGAYETQTDCMNPRLAMNDTPSFTVNPNPTTGHIQVQTSIDNPRISLVDILGRTLFVTNKKEMDLSDFPKGIYIINLEHNGKFLGASKIVKE